MCSDPRAEMCSDPRVGQEVNKENAGKAFWFALCTALFAVITDYCEILIAISLGLSLYFVDHP